ncbi:MAG TPA: hypothetical protein DDZ53_05320 [Firmicutes bacterium]|nr:hypothetical protein [Bacillota bacterium]
MAHNSRKLIARLLTEVKRIAGNASLTGSLEDGKQVLINTYNKCLEALQSLPDADLAQVRELGIFAELPRNASIDEVGVAAGLLVSIIKDDEKPRGIRLNGAPFPPNVKITFGDDDDDDDDDEEDDEEDDDDEEEYEDDDEDGG